MSSSFGLNHSDRLVHVSEVARGIACQCRCVVCGESLIARQGAVREHHFAHASGLEPCEVSHESLLHQYAKRLIQEAGGLIVPLTDSVIQALGLGSVRGNIDAPIAARRRDRKAAGRHIRPDLLAYTDQGLALAIEVAYSSFCDLTKVAHFATMTLPAIEIDLRAFTPECFDPDSVRSAVIDVASAKTWLWPIAEPGSALVPAPTPATSTQKPPTGPLEGARLPEEIITISGRWVSIKEFPSGDIAVKVIRYDPDVVSMVRSLARANFAHYSSRYKSWNVPRWRAEAVRQQLRMMAKSVSIVVQNRI